MSERSDSEGDEKQIADLPNETFEAGEVIFREGDDSKDEAYLVHQGAVEVRRRVDGEERVLNTLGKGDLLGEVALFRDGPHSVTAVAIDQVTLIPISAIVSRAWSSPTRNLPSS